MPRNQEIHQKSCSRFAKNLKFNWDKALSKAFQAYKYGINESFYGDILGAVSHRQETQRPTFLGWASIFIISSLPESRGKMTARFGQCAGEWIWMVGYHCGLVWSSFMENDYRCVENVISPYLITVPTPKNSGVAPFPKTSIVTSSFATKL